MGVHALSPISLFPEGHSQVALPLTSPLGVWRAVQALRLPVLSSSLFLQPLKARGKAGAGRYGAGGGAGRGRGAGAQEGARGGGAGVREEAPGAKGRARGAGRRGAGGAGRKAKGEWGTVGRKGRGAGPRARGAEPPDAGCSQGRRPAGNQAAGPRAPAAPRQLQGARRCDRRSWGRGAGVGGARPRLGPCWHLRSRDEGARAAAAHAADLLRLAARPRECVLRPLLCLRLGTRPPSGERSAARAGCASLPRAGAGHGAGPGTLAGRGPVRGRERGRGRGRLGSSGTLPRGSELGLGQGGACVGPVRRPGFARSRIPFPPRRWSEGSWSRPLLPGGTGLRPPARASGARGSPELAVSLSTPAAASWCSCPVCVRSGRLRFCGHRSK